MDYIYYILVLVYFWRRQFRVEELLEGAGERGSRVETPVEVEVSPVAFYHARVGFEGRGAEAHEVGRQTREFFVLRVAAEGDDWHAVVETR